MGPTLESIEKASRVLQDVTLPTHLIKSPVFSLESGNDIYLKPENLQLTGAFKIRGAYYKISCLSRRRKGPKA